MSEYDFRPGGGLKLKGGVANGGIKKKKSSKTRAKTDQLDKVEHLRRERTINDNQAQSATGTDEVSPNGSDQVPSSNTSDRRTSAERRFNEIQRRRRGEKVAKLASKTHKERVQEFNEKLEALSEHHDIPKVGPG